MNKQTHVKCKYCTTQVDLSTIQLVRGTRTLTCPKCKQVFGIVYGEHGAVYTFILKPT